MKTHSKTQLHLVPLRLLTDEQLQDEFDALVANACRGDHRAAAAIEIAFRESLVRAARAEMGEFAQDAEDVVQDFFVFLLEGESPFLPQQGRAIAWLHEIVRTLARKYRRDRAREWGLDEEGR